MSKEKRADKDNDEKKAKDTEVPEAVDDFATVKLPPDALRNAFTISPEMLRSSAVLSGSLYGLSGMSLGTIGSLRISPETIYGVSSISPHTISLGQDLEDKIDDLRRENRKLVQEVADKTKALERKEIKIDELKETIEQLRENKEKMSQEQRLQYLFYRVHPSAWEKLKEDDEFRKLFEQKTPCHIVIMAIDIRRSTELMLKAKDADSYQSFIIALCAQLKQIILDNYGVFDKFTGDGILAFFPEFYSGDDALYMAVKAADECHACFSKHYENNRSCFTVVLKDVGLGIGIDYGDTYLVNVQDWLTVIGTPVVYACRLSGAPAGQTLLNQQAYDVASHSFGGYINFQDYELHIKNEGNILAYTATLAKKVRKIKLPSWLEASATPES